MLSRPPIAEIEVIRTGSYIRLSLWLLLMWDYGGLTSRIFNRINALPSVQRYHLMTK